MRAVEIGSSAEHGSSSSSVRLDGEGACDAEPLLLSAREAEGAALEDVLRLVPEGGPPQRGLDAVGHVALHAERARAVGDVVEDRLRERVRPLEDHADAAAHLDRVDARRVQVGAVVVHRPVTDAPGTRSFIRLRLRRSVLLPQPDGPMKAVIRCFGIESVTSATAGLPA